MFIGMIGPLPAAEVQRPNVVMVFIDDMGWGDFSCFGNPDAKTPNIDRLASEGLRFSQFYVNAPICSPSRCALTTGQYPHRWRITSYLDNRAANARRGVADWLDPKAPTLARILHQNGYATGHFGKWHLGGQRDVDDAPPITAYGFDKSLTNFEGMGPKLLPLTLKPGDAQPGKIWADAERLGKPFTWMQRSEITSGFVNAAIDFIDRSAHEGKPFYVNVWPDDVHSPFWPPVDKWAETKRGKYLAVLQEMDRQLGKLFDHIRNDPSLRENTLVLVCSDNGPENGAGSAGPFRGAKTRLYEGGIRSPLIAWAPGLIPASKQGGLNEKSVFAAFDLVPSLLTMTNAKVSPEIRFDGEDVSDALIGRDERSRKAPIFWRRPPDRKNSPPGMPRPQPDLAVRDGDWKLLCDYDGSNPELYDLAVDRGETKNLADRKPDVVARLTDAAVAWHRSMPADNGPALGEQAIRNQNADANQQAPPKDQSIRKTDGATKASKKRPNMLVILADDCTFSDLPIYGGKNAVTPNLEKLSNQGLTFDRAYVSSAMCQPCRAELFTGQHPVRNGCAWNHSASRPETRSLPQFLAPLGYRTGIAGKIHVAPKASFPFENVPGFDANAVREPTTAHDLSGIREFMTRDEKQPFCLVVGLVEPHVPWVMGDRSKYPPDQIQLPPHLADTPKTRQDFGAYLAEMTYMDGQVGEILAALDATGLAEDTLVLFSSEQGAQFPGSKWTCWDVGLHTALIARWPGRIKVGARTDAIVQYADVAPTIVELAGGQPADSAFGFDGTSFVAVLEGNETRHRDFAYAVHNNYPEGTPYPVRSVTDGEWRYIRNLRSDSIYIEKHLMGLLGGATVHNAYWSSWMATASENPQTFRLVQRYMVRPSEELYHTTADPAEMTNLAASPKHAGIRIRLSNELDRWLASQNDPGAKLDTPEAQNAAKQGKPIYPAKP